MSSEMREVEVLLNKWLVRYNELIQMDRTNEAEQVLRCINEGKRALLARTEAGADGAVAWRVEWDEDNDGDAFYVTLDTERGAMGRANEAIAEGFKGVRIRRLVYGDTHPQDASGDAVMREALERIRDYEGDPRTPVRNSVRKSGIARAALNAMQAKEAK